MKIGIVAPVSPAGVVGGAERLWAALARRLRRRGHDVELVTIAVHESSLTDLLDAYQSFLELDVTHFDLVITGKYPAWMVRHPHHVVYLLHPLRGLYDTYPTTLPSLDDHEDGPVLRSRLDACLDASALLALGRRLLDELGVEHPLCALPGPLTQAIVQRLDSGAFAKVSSFAAISEEVAGRPAYLPSNQPILVAHPETDLPVADVTSDPGALFVSVSRLDRPKRIDLVIEAFREHLHDPYARLAIIGEGPDRDRLEQLAGTDDRISFLGSLPDDELASWYARATAVVFVPLAEDFGYVSLEAMRAGTPVISTSDAGGAIELIEHGVSGLIMEPDPRRLAWGMAHVASSISTRWHLGLNARRAAAQVNWDTLVDVIEDVVNTDPRPRVLVLSTYPVAPAVGGGQRRIFQLDRSLSERADVTVLVLSARTTTDRRRRIGPGLVQIEIARSGAAREAEEAIYDVVAMPVDDLTAGVLAPATPSFGRELRAQIDQSDLIVLSQPFLATALPADITIPIVHDSQNAEFRMKADLLPDDEAGAWLLALGVGAETAATERAALLVACTDADLADIASLGSSIDGHHPSDVPGIVVPNGVDTAALPMRSDDDRPPARAEVLALARVQPDDPRPLAVFIGSWHPPNIAAARLILELAEARPDWLFVLAGSHTSEFAEGDSPLSSNVHLIPIFDEGLLWPLLAAADVALNPMVSGGGSNLKLFDYLAVGTPVLATAIGARGLDDPADYVVLAEPDTASLSLGLDRIMAQSRTEAAITRTIGRNLVEQRYDWPVLGTRWAEALLATIVEPPPFRRHLRRSERAPILATIPVPNTDPVLAAMDALEQLALHEPPTTPDTTMHPVIRERLQQANANRHVGRVLPDTARFRAPKKLLIRLGHALSNEQVVYNEATLAAIEQMAQELDRLTVANEQLRARIDELGGRLDRASETGQD